MDLSIFGTLDLSVDKLYNMYTINCRRYTSKPQKNEKAVESLSKNLLL